jgi:protein-L-isoaspartate(D-aspartate) O-methyltransferase
MRALLLGVFIVAAPALADDDDFAALRADLVDEVRVYAGYAGDDPFSDAVLEVVGRVERHRFVPPGQVRYAYENRPLPIGHGQTISQPYIVALMTDLLEPGEDDVVLEVGTGSGYQAAVLAELVDQVYSIGACAVRLDHRDRRRQPRAATADRATQAGRKDGYPRRRAIHDATAVAAGKGR